MQEREEDCLFSICLDSSYAPFHARIEKKDRLKVEEASLLEEKGISQIKICEILGIKKDTLSSLTSEMKSKKRCSEQTDKRVFRIIDAVNRLGCATIHEISEESGVSIPHVQKVIPEIVRKGKLEKISLTIGKKSRHYFRSRDLFGSYAGSMLFYRERKEMLAKLAEIVPNPAERGLKASLTRYLRNFGLTGEEIEELYRVKDFKNAIVNVQLKPSEFFLLDSFRLIEEVGEVNRSKSTDTSLPGVSFSFLS